MAQPATPWLDRAYYSARAPAPAEAAAPAAALRRATSSRRLLFEKGGVSVGYSTPGIAACMLGALALLRAGALAVPGGAAVAAARPPPPAATAAATKAAEEALKMAQATLRSRIAMQQRLFKIQGGASNSPDVRMDKRDMAAMEEGSKNCKCFLAIVTDNGADSYFSREMCRKEIRWAQEAARKIVPVCSQADKGRIGQFIQESLVQEVDFSAYNFVVRPSPAPPAPSCEVARASLLTVRPDTPAGRRPLGSESAQGLARGHHRPGGLGQGSREEGRLSQVCRFEAGLLHRRDFRHQDPGG